MGHRGVCGTQYCLVRKGALGRIGSRSDKSLALSRALTNIHTFSLCTGLKLGRSASISHAASSHARAGGVGTDGINAGRICSIRAANGAPMLRYNDARCRLPATSIDERT